MTFEGDLKDWTKDCQECPYRKKQYCIWGVYIKVLWGTIAKRHCEYRNKPPQGNHSDHDVEMAEARIARREMKGKVKLEKENTLQGRLL